MKDAVAGYAPMHEVTLAGSASVFSQTAFVSYAPNA
jgi:hypothetical protein